MPDRYATSDVTGLLNSSPGPGHLWLHDAALRNPTHNSFKAPIQHGVHGSNYVFTSTTKVNKLIISTDLGLVCLVYQ